jgi:hypothetical protein
MKKHYLILLLSLILGNVYSQSFNWAVKGGLYAYDYGYGIATDAAGNVIVAGKYEQAANFSGTILPIQGNHDIWLAKYTAAGALTWITTGGGSLGDYAHGLATDGSTFIYVTGEIEGGNNLITFPGSSITLTCTADNDIFLAKYDLNGTLLWARSAGSSLSDKGLAVTYDNSGNAYMCGYFENTCTFGGSTNVTSAGAQDIFIAKYDASGNFQWVKSAGSPGRDEPKAIKCDASGNIYMCGFYSNGMVMGSNTYSTTSGSYFDAFLSKYDSNGNLQWVKTDGGNYDDVAWGLTMDNAGKIYTSGEFNASAYFGSVQLITSGNADAYIACYDNSGTVQWAKKAGGPLIDRVRGMGTDGNNLYITGQFGSVANFGSIALSAADSSDIFFAVMDNSGNFTKAGAVGGTPDSVETLGYESGNAICADAAGNAYATGSFLNNAIFGATTLNSYARTDVFVTSIGQFLNVNELDISSDAFEIYPNPTSGSFCFNNKNNTKTEICIHDCLGKNILKKETSDAFVTIDLSNEVSGFYFVELKTNDKEILRKKIVLQK